MTLHNRAPLIVLAVLPAAVQAQLDGLRRVHYPPERNRVPAHCTLFHAIPGMVADELAATLAVLAASTAPPRARIGGVIDLDGGTAFEVISPELVDLRDALADRFHGLLSGGDAVAPRLHVTIQNKVERSTARALQGHLRATWQSLDITIPALAVHRVIAGSWHPVGTWRLRRAR